MENGKSYFYKHSNINLSLFTSTLIFGYDKFKKYRFTKILQYLIFALHNYIMPNDKNLFHPVYYMSSYNKQDILLLC